MHLFSYIYLLIIVFSSSYLSGYANSEHVRIEIVNESSFLLNGSPIMFNPKVKLSDMKKEPLVRELNIINQVRKSMRKECVVALKIPVSMLVKGDQKKTLENPTISAIYKACNSVGINKIYFSF